MQLPKGGGAVILVACGACLFAGFILGFFTAALMAAAGRGE